MIKIMISYEKKVLITNFKITMTSNHFISWHFIQVRQTLEQL